MSRQQTAAVQRTAAPYLSQLKGLESYYLGQLNSLYASAKQEHAVHKLSNKALYNKYFAKAMNLSDSADGQVNRILFQLKRKLQAQNLPTTIISQIHSEYIAAVKSEYAKMASKMPKGS